MGFKTRERRARRAAEAAAAAEKPPALAGANPDLVMATVIDIFHKVGGLGGGALFPAVMMHELVPGSRLAAGFGVIAGRASFATVWVELGGERYDPGTAILRVLDESFAEEVALADAPAGPRVDGGDPAQDARAAESLALYRSDPRAWWARAPPGMLRIRKFLRK